jgi:short-subunit dehydrogenase
MKLKTKTALITGASSGIGFELAKLFAKDNYDLIIVSRDEKRLTEAADVLLSEGAGKVMIIAKDLSVPGSASEVYAETKREGILVNVLVNDAGVGLHGEFVHNNLEKEIAIIQLNIVSLVQLTKLYLRDMLSHNEGRILQVASIASYQPTPLLAVYAATKAFVLSFTDALINELENSKVTMTALIPGATATDFFRKAGAAHTKAAQDNPEDPAVVAKIGYEALMKGEHHAVPPGVKKEIIMSTVLPNEKIASQARTYMEPEGE